jgi:hypothetical protein
MSIGSKSVQVKIGLFKILGISAHYLLPITHYQKAASYWFASQLTCILSISIKQSIWKISQIRPSSCRGLALSDEKQRSLSVFD